MDNWLLHNLWCPIFTANQTWAEIKGCYIEIDFFLDRVYSKPHFDWRTLLNSRRAIFPLTGYLRDPCWHACEQNQPFSWIRIWCLLFRKAVRILPVEKSDGRSWICWDLHSEQPDVLAWCVQLLRTQKLQLVREGPKLCACQHPFLIVWAVCVLQHHALTHHALKNVSMSVMISRR